MSIELDLQLAVENEANLPTTEEFSIWLEAAVTPFQPQAEVTIRIVDRC